MICSPVNLLFFLFIILRVDGLRYLYAGTAGRGQVRSAGRPLATGWVLLAREQETFGPLDVSLGVVPLPPGLIVEAQTQRLRVVSLLNRRSKCVVVNKLHRLDSKCRSDRTVIYRDQVVPVLFFGKLGQVGRPKEHDRFGIVEINDDELVMNHVRKTRRHLRIEGRRNQLGQGCGLDELPRLARTKVRDARRLSVRRRLVLSA